jgi:hypothetical protein
MGFPSAELFAAFLTALAAGFAGKLLERQWIRAGMRVGSRAAALLLWLFAGTVGLVAVVMVVFLDCLFAESWYVTVEAQTFLSTPGIITRNTGKWCDRELEYDYSVGGVAFHGSGLRRDHIRNMPDDDELVKDYPVGKAVPVYYKPGDPRVCSLEPGLTWQHVLAGIPPVAAFNAGVLGPLILGLWQEVRRRRSGRDNLKWTNET